MWKFSHNLQDESIGSESNPAQSCSRLKKQRVINLLHVARMLCSLTWSYHYCTAWSCKKRKDAGSKTKWADKDFHNSWWGIRKNDPIFTTSFTRSRYCRNPLSIKSLTKITEIATNHLELTEANEHRSCKRSLGWSNFLKLVKIIWKFLHNKLIRRP